MSGRCANPYCSEKEPEMRLLTQEEYKLLEAEAEENIFELVKKGEIRLMICRNCNVWTLERWDSQKQEMVQSFVSLPYRFKIGDRLKVNCQGKRFGKVGTVRWRNRLVKAVMPPPVPENYYLLVFGGGELEEYFEEKNLSSAI